MHDVDTAGLQRLGAAAAALHIQDFDLEALRAIKAAGLRHPQRQDGVDRLRNSDLELRLGGHQREYPQARNNDDERGEQTRAAPGMGWHCFLPEITTPSYISFCDCSAQNSRSSRPYPPIRS